MRPENAARTLAIIGTALLIIASLIRVFAAYILTIDLRFISGGVGVADSERKPLMDLYTFSQDGTKVSFTRGITVPTSNGAQNMWVGDQYTYDLAADSLQPGAVTTDPGAFQNFNGQLVINDERTKLFLAGREIVSFFIDPAGYDLAFIEPQEDGEWALFTMRGAQEYTEIYRSSSIADVSWQSNGERLAFVAPVNQGDEVFVYTFAGQQLQQVTTGGSQKSNPVVSLDGKRVAYLVTPREERMNTIGKQTPTPLTLPPQLPLPPQIALDGGDELPEIYVVDIAGANAHRLTDNNLAEYNLSWTAGGKVAYSVRQKDWPMVAWLYSLDLQTGQSQRIYPSTAVDRLTCSPDLWGANTANVTVTISNTGTQPQTVPLEIAADRIAVDVVGGRSQHRAHREEVPLNPGESRTLTLTIDIPNDQKAYLAATVESGVEFPISASFCQVHQRTLLLPRLRWFSWSLILVLIGSLLSIPWLRHQKNPWLWRLWAFYLVLLAVLIGIESAVILGLFD